MTLNKAYIIEEVRIRNGLTRKKATEAVEIILKIVKGKLASGEDVLISGFGKFCVKEKKERRGRNPATGGDLMLRQRKVITFRCSGKLRNWVNNKYQDHLV